MPDRCQQALYNGTTCYREATQHGFDWLGEPLARCKRHASDKFGWMAERPSDEDIAANQTWLNTTN